MGLRFYRRILDGYEPFIIARRPLWAGLERSPLGIEVPDGNVFDPQVAANGPFLRQVELLDELTYGPRGLTMPSWVFYDCAVVPGTCFGFGIRAAKLPAWVRGSLRVPADYDGLVPVSLFIAIPMAHRKARLVFTLCSINQVAPGAAPDGLWRLTLAAGIAALGVDVMVATAQWRSSQLGLYASLGPLKVITAWTPAHDIPETATFWVRTDPRARERLLRGSLVPASAVDRYLDADDGAQMLALQLEVEAGRELWVLGPAEIRGAETRVPLADHGLPRAALQPEGDFVRRFQG